MSDAQILMVLLCQAFNAKQPSHRSGTLGFSCPSMSQHVFFSRACLQLSNVRGKLLAHGIGCIGAKLYVSDERIESHYLASNWQSRRAFASTGSA